MTSPRARVCLIGLGPIGIEVGKALAGREGIELAGAADPAPDKAGRPLASMLDGAFPGVVVAPSAAARRIYRAAGIATIPPSLLTSDNGNHLSLQLGALLSRRLELLILHLLHQVVER